MAANKHFLHQAGAVTKVVFARLRFLSVFLVAGFIVGYWDNIKNHWDKWTRPSVAPDALAAAAVSDVEYYCVMHPNIVRGEPGNCPICGMPLVKRKRGELIQLPEDVLARVQLSPERIALAGVQTSPVEYRALTRDVHAVGILDYDETKVAQLSARVAGRADQLFVQYVGQAVRKGDPVYTIYSPDVYTALREYLLARQRVNQLAKDAPAEARADATAVYNASLKKLVLWGISQEQLDQADKEFDQSQGVPTNLVVNSPISGIVVKKDIFEGGYVNVGDRPYTIADLGSLWLKAKVYEEDVSLVHIGQPVEVTVGAMRNESFRGTVAFKSFQLDPETRTLDARIQVKNTDLRLRPGMFADATVRVPLAGAPAPATTQAVVAAGDAVKHARAYRDAIQPYLKAQSLMASDKGDGVSQLLGETAAKLEPLAVEEPAVADSYQRLAKAVHAAAGKDLAGIRDQFKEISGALIEMGKTFGLPGDAPAIQVFRCPMKKATWLQPAGTTANPYYGAEMLTCGAAVEALPKVGDAAAAPAHAPGPAGKVLAIPYSSVIDTGRHQIVYVESAPGVYDMRAVKLGPLSEDYFPVESGLEQGERVVTVGAFLIDSENRLNPLPTSKAPPATVPAAHVH